MRTKDLVAVCVASSFWVLTGTAQSLTKSSVRFTEGATDAWNAGSTCTVSYYNTCSGYVWLWSGFEDGERVSQIFDSCAAVGSLDVVQTVHWNGAPSGYGYTGTLDVYLCGLDPIVCPDEMPRVSLPFLPQETGQGAEITNHLLGVIASYTAILVTMAFAGDNNPASIPTDQAYAPCVPPRTSHSHRHGTASEPLCPGEPFVAVAESCELLWAIGVTLFDSPYPVDCDPVSLRPSSWSQVKALYH